MALAPASIVFKMLSPVFPPEAIIGTVGYSKRIFHTISGVSLPPAIFSMEAPERRRSPIFVSLLTTVITIGMSTHSEIDRMLSFEIGALRIIPIAP